MADDAGGALPAPDVVPRPQLAESIALHRELADQCGQARVVGVGAGLGPQLGDHGDGALFPVLVVLARFMESTARDVAPFNIGVTIVEPGDARTEFRYDSLKLAEPMTEYDGTPAAMVRGVKDRSRPSAGDPAKMAARIIASADVEPARFLTAALSSRLAEVQAQAATAPSTAWTDH